MRKRTAESQKAPPEASIKNDRQFVTALHRGLEILRAFRPTDRIGLGNRELAERTRLPNSTVSRLTFTLWKLGYITYDESSGRYSMSVPVLGLGYACLGGMHVLETARNRMQELADSCGDGVLVAVGGRDDMTMTYLACARSVGLISLQLDVGSRVSLPRSAMGRAYIAGTSESERTEIQSRIKEKEGADKSRTTLKSIDDAREQIAERGFYANIGGWHANVNAVSVPYRSPDMNTPMMSFNLGGPSYNLTKKRLEEELGPKLVELVNRVGQTG